jgi:hypothetical protein
MPLLGVCPQRTENGYQTKPLFHLQHCKEKKSCGIMLKTAEGYTRKWWGLGYVNYISINRDSKVFRG